MRNRAFLLALAGVLLVCLPLIAADEAPFSVGIVALQDEASSLLTLVAGAGDAYASTLILPNEAYSTHLMGREQREMEKTRLLKISSAYASQSEKELEKALQPLPVPKSDLPKRLPVTYREIPLKKGYSLLLDTFASSRPWFTSQEGLDALVLVKQTKIASKDRIRLYWYDLFTDTTDLIFDQVVIDNDNQRLQEEMGMALLSKSAGPEYALLLFDGYTSSISIAVDGKPLRVKGGEALLLFGEYSLLLTREGYVPREMTITVLPNTVLHIPTTLERIPMEDMKFFSPEGNVSWFVDGVFYGEACSLSMAASLVPLVVVAQKEGFSSKTIQIQKPFKEIKVTLQPEWMDNSLLLQQRQRDFYTSFRNSMLVFGLYVASSTLSRTFDVANPLWQPLQVATSGFALVSSLHTIMNLASYAALAGSGVR